MKLKFYLRGLGVGLIVTTLLFMFGDLINSGNETLAQNSTQSNYPTVTSILNSTKAETKAATEAETKAETKDDTKTETAAETKVDTKLETETKTEALAETKAISETEATKVPVTVILENIMYSEKAAQVIAEAGIVNDWADFNNYLSNSGYSVRIHNGIYTLYKGQDYETIAKIITGISK